MRLLKWIAILSCAAGAMAKPSTQPAAAPNAAALFAPANLTAWCIVPFDGKHRGPADRAQMLDRIGLHHFAYDWRDQHLPGFPTELDELDKHHITLDAVWFPDALDHNARFLLDTLAQHHVGAQLWVGSWRYDKLPQAQRVDAAVKRLRPIADAAAKIGCTLGIYNHGGWLGEPDNQIEVVRALKNAGVQNVGIVYNLHHGYGDLDHFKERFTAMLPYLLAVNLNGMSPAPAGKSEPVVPVGQGALDLPLLRTILESGYSGHIGIINESDEDAELRLQDNIAGVAWLARQLDGQPAGERPQPRSWQQVPASTQPAHD